MQVQARKNPVELQTLLLLITIWMIIFEDSRLPNSPLPQASRLPNSPPTPYWPCHTCDLIFLDGNKNYCSITAMPGSLLLPNWLIILYVCLSSLPPPPPFVSFFLRVTLSEEEEGVGWSRSNFGPPLPLPPPASFQIKHFYNHPSDQHMLRTRTNQEQIEGDLRVKHLAATVRLPGCPFGELRRALHTAPNAPRPMTSCSRTRFTATSHSSTSAFNGSIWIACSWSGLNIGN